MRKMLAFLFITLAIPVAVVLSGLTSDTKHTVRHIVVFKYKPGTTETQIKQVTDAFRGLKSKIPGIVSFEYGVNNSPEGKSQGFNHIYFVTFENEKARDTYLPHPEHKKFGELLGSLEVLEDAFVVDYEPKN